MGRGTYLIIPTPEPLRVKRALEGVPDDGVVPFTGRDFVVFACDDPFDAVQADPADWGPILAARLPRIAKAKLDERGMLACPEVGQTFSHDLYAEEVARNAAPLWLPTKAPPAKARRRERELLLVALSAQRTKLLLEEPALVAQILDAHLTGSLPRALGLDAGWIRLQQLFLEVDSRCGAEHAEAWPFHPRVGMPLYDDATIQSARLLSAEQVRPMALWLGALSEDAVASAAKSIKSPLALNFPLSLGLGAGPLTKRATSSRTQKPAARLGDFEHDLARVRAFYAQLLGDASGLLIVHYRAPVR